MQVEANRMYRVRMVARMFDVSAATIYRAIQAGQLKAVKIGSKAVRVPGSAVLDYWRLCRDAATDSTSRRAPGSDAWRTAPPWLNNS